MDQALTIREAGAEGVMLAIADSMKAAKVSRENEALSAEIERLKEENGKLKRTLRQKDQRIAALSKANRSYCRQHIVAYEKYLCMQREYSNSKPERLCKYLIAFTVGMVSIMVLTIMIMIFL